MAPDCGAIVRGLFPGCNDDAILDYIASSVEDEDFEFGPDGEAAFDALGALLVRASWHAAQPAWRD